MRSSKDIARIYIDDEAEVDDRDNEDENEEDLDVMGPGIP